MNGAIFTRDGLEWRCHVIESGQRYEWRTQCGLTCHRYGRDYFAFDRGQPVGRRYSSLRDAFDGAREAQLWKGKTASDGNSQAVAEFIAAAAYAVRS